MFRYIFYLKLCYDFGIIRTESVGMTEDRHSKPRPGLLGSRALRCLLAAAAALTLGPLATQAEAARREAGGWRSVWLCQTESCWAKHSDPHVARAAQPVPLNAMANRAHSLYGPGNGPVRPR